MADGGHHHRATGGGPRRRGTPRRAGGRRSVDPLTAAQEGIDRRLSILGNPLPSPTNRFAMLRVEDLDNDISDGPDDVAAAAAAAGPGDPASRPDVVSRHRHDLRRSGAASQASSSAAPTTDGGVRRGLETRRVTDESGPLLILPHGFLSQASSSAAPSSHHPGAEGRIRVRQSVLYSDRPRHSRPRRPARAEARIVRSREIHRPVMDLPTFQGLSLGDPSLSTPETTEMTNVDHALRSEEEHTCVVNSSVVDREEALSLNEPPLLTPQTETDEESTDDDCAWSPSPINGQPELFFNRPKGLSLSMVMSTPLFITVPNVKEERPKLYSDVDPKDVKRSIKEYLDGRPCLKLRATSYNILDVEDPTPNARAAELGTESQPPNVITEQASVAAAHPQHSLVPNESRQEASAEEIVPDGTAWMKEEVMLCFKKFIDMSQHLAKLEDYHLDELQHQCFNVECYSKVYHHYNFTVRMKMPRADWKVKQYFAEVKEVFRKKYYLCYPLDPNENGQCYACKKQGVDDLRHPAIDMYEMGSPDASCSLWYT